VIEKLLNAIDMAEYVFVDKEGRRLFVWHGGSYVNIYGLQTGECIDAFNNENHKEMSAREIHDAIMEHIQETS